MTDDEERLKLAWEVAVMDLPIDRARADIEKNPAGFRQDSPGDLQNPADMALDQSRFWVQLWGVVATAIAAVAGAFAAGATWWNYVHH